MSFSSRMYPRNLTGLLCHSQLSSLAYRLFSRSFEELLVTVENVRLQILSRLRCHDVRCKWWKWFWNSLRILFIDAYKTEGAFKNPYSVTKYLQWPMLVLYAVFLSSLSDVNEVMWTLHVRFYEYFWSLYLFYVGRSQWKVIMILHCDFIQTLIVDARLKSAIFFSTKKLPAPAREAEGWL